MEKRLFYRRLLPLKELALRRTTFNMWIESILDKRHESPVSQDTVRSMKDKWLIIEVTVRDKISKFVVPESLKKQISGLVKPIGQDILLWILQYKGIFREGFESFDLRALLHLRFTWLGAIDYRNTAEEFICHEIIDIKYRFELACLHCLEDKILLLWDKIPVELMNYYDRLGVQSRFLVLSGVHMEYYWISVLRKEGFNLEQMLQRESMSLQSFYKKALRISASNGNKAATEYFLKKLGNDEKRDALLRAANEVFHERFLLTEGDVFSPEIMYDVICYLLSLMTPEQQMQIFKERPLDVLFSFLFWPLQYLFLDIIDICWSFLPESSYASLLSKIILICFVHSGYNYPNLFQEFFMCSPVSFKKFFVYLECLTGSLLRVLFRNVDIETIQVVFRNIDTADRARLVLSEAAIELMSDYLLRGHWNVVVACVREATLSKEDRGRLKRDFMKYVNRKEAGLKVMWTPRQRRFFELLDEMDGGGGSAEGDALAKVKKPSQ